MGAVSESFLQAVFRRYEPNERTKPLIDAACRDWATVLDDLSKVRKTADPFEAGPLIQGVFQEYGRCLCERMDEAGRIGTFSQGMVLRDIANASMLSVYALGVSPPLRDTYENRAVTLILQARMQAVMMICAADAGAVFG
jgi:hypothetical protein